MKRLFGVFYMLIFSLFMTGCASQNISAYQDGKPTLDMRRFFSGDITGYGMFQGRNGEVKKRFEVLIRTKEEGDVLILDESFVWSDGTTSKRLWRLTEQADGTWKGTADDVVGEAVGTVAGNALHWKYSLLLPVDDKTYNVDLDDWMYLINDDVILNRSTMSKFGVNLGSVTLSLHRKK